ncbi:hypothetical protein GA0061078_1680 [Bifidobacterium bohemicum]|uniref:Uncharacterized protein n=2 Tax=Bifidobacterium bohemicum TaxID=638617 RepID=A0A086ZH90_9BIFI|nr:hypothetical protein [Bifidobacterium bohemicum]KFI45890.1 hypothetical protein BBOH_0696 [Bifidobacterium bohemicum DSM 22767]SCC16422.1 hypothetical protein GA0061078_1680 [Bifidobacterium bohemicum]
MAERRDFTANTKQQLMHWAEEIEAESGWDKFADLSEESFEMGLLPILLRDTIETSSDTTDKYKRTLLEINDASKRQIVGIWSKVNNDASTALTNFVATQSDLEGFRRQVDILAQAMGAGSTTGTLDLSYIAGALNGIDDYNKKSKLFHEMASTKGLASKTAHDTKTAPALLEALKTMGGKFAKYLPNLEVGQEWSIPVGPGLELTYRVSARDGDGRTTLSVPGYVAKDQRGELLSMISESQDLSSVRIDDNGRPVNTPGNKDYTEWTSGINANPSAGLGGSWSRKHGDKTQTFTLNVNRKSLTVTVGVSQDVGNSCSVASELGLSAALENHWVHFRKPQPVRQPVSIPSLNLNWEVQPLPPATKTAIETEILVTGALLLLLLLLLGFTLA